jgi:CrcB protein
MTALELVGVIVGGAVGTVVRYLTDLWLQARFAPALPWGTLVVNLAGSFILGGLVRLSVDAGLGAAALALLGAGFCGGLTTFSSFGWETHRLSEDGAVGLAATNVVANTVGCLLAAGLGWLVVTAVG